MPFRRAVPVAVLLAVAAPAAAHADATLSVTGTAPHKTLTYTVDDPLDHTAVLYVKDGDLVIADFRAIAVGASNCEVIDAKGANCGPAADFERAAFTFGDGNDELSVSSSLPIAITAKGGAGGDELVGGALADDLSGGAGDDSVFSEGGDDSLNGGPGDDFLVGGLGVDVFDGGEGDDALQPIEVPAAADADVSCGAGADVILAYDDDDPIDDDCETVDPPYLDGALSITGEARVGNVLGLSTPLNVGDPGDVAIQWERCEASGSFCMDIDGAGGSTYTPTLDDLGWRLRAWYHVWNRLGYDSVESQATEIVGAARPPIGQPPPTNRPPILGLGVPRPFGPRPKLTAALTVVRKASLAIRAGRPVIDTGRMIDCSVGGDRCALRMTARTSGASARLRGAPHIAGRTTARVAPRASAIIAVPLNRRAYRLLRTHRRLTVTVTFRISHQTAPTVGSMFTITVKAPGRKRH